MEEKHKTRARFLVKGQELQCSTIESIYLESDLKKGQFLFIDLTSACPIETTVYYLFLILFSDADRHSLRLCASWCGWSENATILPFWK